MLIMSQNGENLISVYTLTEIWIDTDSPSYAGKAIIKALTNDYIAAHTLVKCGVTIGVYSSKDEAKKVLVKLMKAAEEGGKVFYMPNTR